MRKSSLKTQIFLAFSLVIVIIGLLSIIFDSYIIQNKIIQRAHRTVKKAIRNAEAIYRDELDDIGRSLRILGSTDDLGKAKEILGWDYVFEVGPDDAVKSEIVKEVFLKKVGLGASRVICPEELSGIYPELPERLRISIKDTPRARPSNKKVLNSVIALEYAIPVISEDGSLVSVRYAGKIINRNFNLVDKISELVFENEIYKDKPVGTVTIFQDDIRIATNVLNEKGERAVGTRVSEEVYDKVVVNGGSWRDRAFVVTDWYFTTYEPIKDIAGNIIGILYVGILEKPYFDLKVAFFAAFLIFVAVSMSLALLISYLLAHRISKPLVNLLGATRKISEGDFSYKIEKEAMVSEFNELVKSFNRMAEDINQRERSLKESKERIETLNKMYLDLIGFVSHELKGILSSVVLNVYSLQKAILGPINEAQEKTIKSIARNIDYLADTVKNFLSLSRVEKGEMRINKREILLKENIFDISNESFLQLIEEKKMEIVNNIEPNIKIYADSDLMHIVANNLLSNAIKYGLPQSKILISSRKSDDEVGIEVYNDGQPIAKDDTGKLFKRFSRIVYSGAEKVKGTGIGLFITKEIIERHSGKIWVEPRLKGNAFKFTLPLK